MEVDTRNLLYSTIAEVLPNGPTIIIVGVIWNSLRFSIIHLLILSILTTSFRMCLILVMTDQPLSNQKLGDFNHEMTSRLLCLVVTLMMRLVRWILLALIRFRVENFVKISAAYIATAYFAFSVFLASRSQFF